MDSPKNKLLSIIFINITLMFTVSMFAQNSCNCNLSSEELLCLPTDFNTTEAVCIGEDENSVITCSDLISKQCI